MMYCEGAARLPSTVVRRDHEELQALIGRAIVDDDFRRDLLNGHRHECVAQFGLSPDERQVVLGVRANDLRSFAAGLEAWLQAGASGASSGRFLAAVA